MLPGVGSSHARLIEVETSIAPLVTAKPLEAEIAGRWVFLRGQIADRTAHGERVASFRLNVVLLTATNRVLARSDVSSDAAGLAFDTIIANVATPAAFMEPARPGIDAAELFVIRVTVADVDTEERRARVARDKAEQQRAAQAQAKVAAAKLEADRRRQEAEAETRRQEMIRGMKWSPTIEHAVIAREVIIGMTPQQVRMAWGDPDAINETITVAGNSQQWVYTHRTFLYFSNGVLTTIQRPRAF